MSDTTVMTAAGLEALKAEIEELETVARPQVVEKIKTAREFGDLKENAEYHAARDEQGMLEAKIKRLRQKLSTAQIVENTEGGDVVGFGSRVEVEDPASGRTHTYTLVSTTEADAQAGRLSIESPVARALEGARLGETVTIALPSGQRSLVVRSIA